MFDVPGGDIVDVIITEDVILNNAAPEYVRRPASDTPASVGVDSEEAATTAGSPETIELRRSSTSI